MAKKCKSITLGNCCALLGMLLLAYVLKKYYIEGFKSSAPSEIVPVEQPLWTVSAKQYNANMINKKRSNYKGTPVPLPEGELFFFKNNKFKPECCPATYTTSSGCACMSIDQQNYLTARAGNRYNITSSDERKETQRALELGKILQTSMKTK